jgi:FkbM family methyltransferase
VNSTSEPTGPGSIDIPITTPDIDQLVHLLRQSSIRRHDAQVAQTPHNEPVPLPPDAPRRRVRGVARSLARKFGARSLRASLPVTRPIARRLRNYFVGPLSDEISDQMRKQSVELRQQMALDVNHLHHLFAAQQAAVLDKIDESKGAAAVILELQWQVASLRHSIFEMIASADSTESIINELDEIRAYSVIAARRAVVPIGDETLMVRTEVGFVMCSANDVAALATLVDTGDLEIGTRRFIEAVLRPGDTFVDVGANLGLHTLAAARVVGSTGRVVCFEPFPETASLLRRTVALNGIEPITEIHTQAVGAAVANRELFIGNNSGHHSLHPLDKMSASPLGSVSVPTVCLDGVIISADERVDLMKIDVEGAELEVIEGARRMLSERPHIGLIVEFGPSHLLRSGHEPESWLSAFGELGFRWEAIDERDGTLRAVSRPELLAMDSVNLFLARETSPMWNRAS